MKFKMFNLSFANITYPRPPAVTQYLWFKVAKACTNKISVVFKDIFWPAYKSRIEETSLEKRPKFLDLYVGIYGN